MGVLKETEDEKDAAGQDGVSEKRPWSLVFRSAGPGQSSTREWACHKTKTSGKALLLGFVCLCVTIILAFQLTAFTFQENLAATALLLVPFGYAVLPWMYLLSGIFPSADVAFISYVSLNFIFGLCTLLMTTMPRLLAIISKAQNLKNVYDTLKWVFMIFPQFCLGQGLIELCYNQIKYDLTHSFGIDSYVSPFEMQFLDWIFVGLATQGTILFLLRVLLHGNLLHWLGYVLKGSSLNKSGQDKSTLEAGGAHG
nr:ATP-binding cassette sub-family A member 13-like isoform X3 [Cavia porcellus]